VGEVLFTEEQRAAIERRDGAGLLAAAAGSGKTSVLVERFVRTCVEDGVAVVRILAITFTEKAANELKERIRAEFLSLGDEERARETEGGSISTIHGFCARLLRAHPLLAEIDPRFTVLDQPGADRVSRESFGRSLDDFLAGGGEPATALVAAYGADPLRRCIVDAHDELRSRGEEPRLPELPPAPPLGPLVDSLEVAAREAGAELAAAEQPGARVVQALEALDACTALLADGLGNGVPLPAAADAAKLPAPNGGSALRTEACERYRGAHESFAAACRDHHAALAYAEMAALLEHYARRYEESKSRLSVLDFGDLELAAHRLLDRHRDVRERVAARCERIMIDEFQDTNPLQLELLELIARDNLFTVGDEFQSIYGFRHADVELFRSRRDALAPAGRTLALRANFRSHPAILGALNVAFTPSFGSRFAPLVPGGEAVTRDAPDESPRVELLVTDCDAPWRDVPLVAPGTPAPAQPWRAAEARLLAQRIRELTRTGGYEHRDVVVLLRATGDIALYERALEDQGVPTYVIGGRGYWAHREVQDLVAHLAVVANPREAMRLYEVLASPLVGLSSDGLVLLGAAARSRSRDPWSVLRDSEPIADMSEEDRARLERWLPWIGGERAAAPRRSLEALIDRALAATGYDLAVLRAPGGQRRLANVRKLMRLAREWELERGRDLRGFLDAVAERVGDDAEVSRESDAPVEGEALDAVRLMTIHRAKGLEFPVVCVADLGRQPPAGGQELLRLGRDGRVGLRLATLDGAPRRGALDWEGIGAAADRAAADEERRLFYVAATRAQERLVLSGGMKAGAWGELKRTSPPLTWIGPAFVPEIADHASGEGGPPHGISTHPDDPRVRVSWAVNRPEHIGEVLREESLAPTPDERSSTASAGGEARRLESAPTAEDPPVAVPALSYSALGRFERCGYRFYLEDVLRLPGRDEDPMRDGAGGGPGLPATTRGSIVHSTLEHADLTIEASPEDAALDAAAAEHGVELNADARSELRQMIAGFWVSSLRRRLAVGRDLRREERFVFSLESRAPEPIVMTGAFDVLIRDGAEALVVDYKTNRLGDRAPGRVVDDEYAVQRLVYALALLRDGAERVEVVFAFLERPDAPVRATFDARDADGLERELVALSAGIVAGEFAVSPLPHRELCFGCPGRGTLCSHSRELTERAAPQPGDPQLRLALDSVT
jgi:ATP-dependent exoDNAse (exonuclease V) beta subunit